MSNEELTTSAQNTFLGYESASTNIGDHNVAVGYNALKGSGSNLNNYNTAIGSRAMDTITTGSNSVAIGFDSLGSITTGSYNTAIGKDAGDSVDTGEKNVFVGTDAGQNTTSQSNCTFVGYEAGTYAQVSNTTGIGYRALASLTSGAGNVCVGHLSGDSLTTGANNTFIGWNTDGSANSAQDQIVIGRNFSGTANSRVHIGNVSSHIFNDFNTNATWTHSSDKRQKKEIKDDTLGLDFINDIRPVTYKHKSPSEFPKEWNAYNENDKEPMGGDKVIHGLIAQEVKQALDKQGIDTFSGWDVNLDGRQNVSFEAFVLPLIKSVQELSIEINKLKQQIKDKS